MKVALVYDRVNKWGGAERVLLALHKIFPKADLYTSVYDEKNAKWAKVFNIKTSFLQDFPYAMSSHEYYALLMPVAFESFSFDGYDLVISVTSEAAKGIITKPETLHVCYCLTPTRYLWSGYEYYFKNQVFKFFSAPLISYLRYWDKIASDRPDMYIAISKEVKMRIKKYYGRNSEIIFPPVSLKSGKEDVSNSQKTESFFLIVSRLVYYKRIDVAIKACNMLNLPLKIVGSGKDEKRLKKIAGSNVEFLKNLTDGELSFYYKNCRALIFPGLEDFGLVMVEAQSFGKPVIALKGGGALDIIKEGETGEFFSQQTPDSLKEVLEKFDDKLYNTKLCIKNAERFNFETFEKNLKSFLNTKFAGF